MDQGRPGRQADGGRRRPCSRKEALDLIKSIQIGK